MAAAPTIAPALASTHSRRKRLPIGPASEEGTALCLSVRVRCTPLAKRDSAFQRVNFQNHHLHRIALRERCRPALARAVWVHFAPVEEPLKPRLDLDVGAVIGEADHLAAHPVSWRIALIGRHLRIGPSPPQHAPQPSADPAKHRSERLRSPHAVDENRASLGWRDARVAPPTRGSLTRGPPLPSGGQPP